MLLRNLAALWLSIAAAVEASPLERRGSNYVKLQVMHSTNQKYFASFWQDKRDVPDVADIPLANRSDVAYYAKLNFGTPAQEVFVQIDTGSFELWINPDCAALESPTDRSFCRNTGIYQPTSSDSFNKLAETNFLQYGIGNASIQYVTDTVALAGSSTTLKNVQFGVAVESSQEFAGILGIGYGENITIPYKNLIDQLADQGATNTKAFSIALGSKDEQEGVAIFGGLDTSKFSGNLATLPIIPAQDSPDQVPRYWVQMNSVSLTTPDGQSKQFPGTSLPVFMDSGSTLTLLPTDVVQTIAADFDGQLASGGVILVDCAKGQQNGTLDFAFEGATVRVPFSEVIRELQTSFGVQCVLGLQASDQFTLLGDTFMRSAYAVFDQTNNAIHVAQYTNCGDNEVEITKDFDFSNVQGDCIASASGTGSPNSASSGSADANGNSNSNSTTNGNGDGTNAAATTKTCFTWLALCAAFCVVLL